MNMREELGIDVQFWAISVQQTLHKIKRLPAHSPTALPLTQLRYL
jgi:hypothetical protein